MRKQFKKIALAAVFAMAVSLAAPAARPVEAASKKTFTYAEQKTGDQVTALVMQPGEKTDLKFMGVSNWKSYTYKWTSSDEKVAVVDSNGLITALKKGVTTIKLTVGDGSEYTSVGVTVHVGLQQKATIGTATEEDIKYCSLQMGDSIVLKATGLMDNVAGRYECAWTSTNTAVAKINSDGVVTPVAPGMTVIQLTVTRVASGEKMSTTPIALLVTSKGSSTVVASPTPTRKPVATATPVPTTAPVQNVTATPTPTLVPDATVTPAPSGETVPYTTKLESDSCLVLTFNKAVDYDMSDISLYQLISAGSAVVESKTDITDATLSENGRELRVVPITNFNDGEKYIVKVGSADEGRTFTVNIGAPARLEVTYECLGTEGVAYAYDEEIAIDVPVTFKYRVYTASGIDVTEKYSSRGWINYEIKKENENVIFDGESVSFLKSGISTVVNAVFSYQDDKGDTKELTRSVALSARKLPAYNVSGVIKYTIIDGSEENKEKIDWNKTENEVVSNTETAKLVVLVADTYGNYYTNDERGVDEENHIYFIEDDHLFTQFGYGIEFNAADSDKLIIDGNGAIYPYQKGSAVVLTTLVNNGMNGINNYNKNIGACSIRILAESELNSLAAETTKVTVSGMALEGYESRFCETDVELYLKDQYGKEWKGDYNLELSCNLSDINSALDGTTGAPASLDGTKLHINAESIKAIAPNKTSVTFRITETNLKKTISVTVSIKNPILSNNAILVKNWSLGIPEETVTLGNFSLMDNVTTQSVVVEALKLSSNGVAVGLYEDLHVLDETNHKFTTSNCSEDEVYVLVLGPDGKPLKEADSNSVGVYVDKLNSCIKVNIAVQAASGSMLMETLAPGKYTVKVTRITDIGNAVKTAVLTDSFVVEDKTSSITFRSLKSKKTSLSVSTENDLQGIKAIIEETMTFNKDGAQWTTFTAENIVDVDYILNNKNVIIKSIEFAIPVDEKSQVSLSYTKLVRNINKAIEIGAD